jgi:hypothetical protein
MRIPPSFVIFRVATPTITLLILLLVGMGLSGRGPLSGLGGITSHAASWLRVTMGAGGQ